MSLEHSQKHSEIEYPKISENAPRLLVVIPTYNEADNVQTITQDVLRQPIFADLLIVDDNSPDGTGKMADALAAAPETEGRVHVLHRAGKEGLGRAYLAGFAWALRTRLRRRGGNGCRPLARPAVSGQHCREKP